MHDFSKVIDWDSACDIISNFKSDSCNCEGNEEATFMSGWVNSADMIDEGTLDRNDAKDVLRCVFSEFDNMGYKR